MLGHQIVEGSRRRRHAVSTATVVALLALLVSSATPVFAAKRTPWNTNLVKNSGAEAGSASSDGYQVVAIPRWTTYRNFTVVNYGELDFPTVAEGQRIGGGAHFFAAGVADADGHCGLATQWIRIVGRDAAIDAGRVRVTLSGFVASYADQIDDARMSAVMATSNEGQAGIAVLETTPVSGTNSIFTKVKSSMIAPAGTRWISIALHEMAHAGGYCDAYFDKVSLKLKLV